MELYAARDKSGILNIFSEKPKKGKMFWMGFAQLLFDDDSLLPGVRWEDSEATPVALVPVAGTMEKANMKMEDTKMDTAKEKTDKARTAFDLAKAEAGAPVCTRGGLPARLLGVDRDNPIYPVAAEVCDGGIWREYNFRADGGFAAGMKESPLDLMMAPCGARMRSGWVVLLPDGVARKAAGVYVSREDAEAAAGDGCTVVLVEWLEAGCGME